MTNEIKSVIDKYLEEFKNHRVVKRYLLLKEELSKDVEFNKIKEAKKKAQKELSLSLNTPSYEAKKQTYLEIENTYNTYPTYMNYLEYEKEVKSLLKDIEIYLN